MQQLSHVNCCISSKDKAALRGSAKDAAQLQKVLWPGLSKAFAQIERHDLVFCTRIGGRGIHHVGIYLEDETWHAHGERGVIRQSTEEFTSQDQILEVIGIL